MIIDKSYYEHFKIIICKQIYVWKITPNEANSRDGLEQIGIRILEVGRFGLVRTSWLTPPGCSLTQGTTGLVIPLSSFLVPQLLSGDDELVITEDQGSWFGK